MNDIPKVEDLLPLNIFPDDIVFVDEELLDELVNCFKNMTKVPSLYVKTITFATSTTSMRYSMFSDAALVKRSLQRLVVYS